MTPERRKEISEYMTAHNWVAEFNYGPNLWTMSIEPYAYSAGPFEVMAIGRTLEEVFEKAKKQQRVTA